jgi:hypothetical protein
MENLKKALERIFKVTMTVDEALEDGKIKGLEWAKIATSALVLPWVFTHFKEIVTELKALTVEQKKELEVWAKATFDLHNDYTEALVEEALMFLLGLVNLTELAAKIRLAKNNVG